MRTRSHVTVNDLRLSYVADGPGEAPVVVLVHGHGASADNWLEIMDGLVADHRVYAMTMRGHHGSDWAPEYSIDLIAFDIAGFVEALGLDKVTLAGHSLGGIACVRTAQLRPGWLARLVLEDTPVPSPGWFRRDMPARPIAPSNDWDNIAPKVNHFLNHPEPNWWQDLANIEVPTLAIGGGEASGFPQRNILGLGERIPDFHTATIDVGHLVHEIAPERFTTLLRGFLSQHS